MPRYQKEPTTINFYYIDASVLLGNTPPVKFIRNYIRERSGVFSISSPTCEDIDDVISRHHKAENVAKRRLNDGGEQ